MSHLTRDSVFLILQFLDEANLKETVHRLEQESGIFFNLKYFEELVYNGNLDDAEHYLTSFTTVDDNANSTKIFFVIRKQKYLEALDKNDRAKAFDILMKDFKVFEKYNKESFKEVSLLLSMDNFREHVRLTYYEDTYSERVKMLSELKKLIKANPLLQKKLQFPDLEPSSLLTLIHKRFEEFGSIPMSTINRNLIFLILQFLDEANLKETVHRLEQESGLFFNLKYFEDVVLNGNWDEVECYLTNFTKLDDNANSVKIFFVIRRQKYVEALDKNDRAKAFDILLKDFKVFEKYNEEFFKKITLLLTTDNIREHELLSEYGDTHTERAKILEKLKPLIKANPLLQKKLKFPDMQSSRLQTLIHQSLNFPHRIRKSTEKYPLKKPFFTDHRGEQSAGSFSSAPVNVPMLASMQEAEDFPTLAAHTIVPLQPASVPVQTFHSGPIANPEAATLPTVRPFKIAHPALIADERLMQSRICSRTRDGTVSDTNPLAGYARARFDRGQKRRKYYDISKEVNQHADIFSVANQMIDNEVQTSSLQFGDPTQKEVPGSSSR